MPCDKTTRPCFERGEAAGNLGSALGATGANAADLDCNGVVNNTDLNILRDAMGRPPGPSGEIPE